VKARGQLLAPLPLCPFAFASLYLVWLVLDFYFKPLTFVPYKNKNNSQKPNN
jgi:hypothetical protein